MSTHHKSNNILDYDLWQVSMRLEPTSLKPNLLHYRPRRLTLGFLHWSWSRVLVDCYHTPGLDVFLHIFLLHPFVPVFFPDSVMIFGTSIKESIFLADGFRDPPQSARAIYPLREGLDILAWEVGGVSRLSNRGESSMGDARNFAHKSCKLPILFHWLIS